MARYKEVMLAYNANGDDVEVNHHPDTYGWTRKYKACVGGAYTAYQKMPWEQVKLHALIDVVTAIIREGVDPKALHREMLKVDEYRDAFVDDVPGVLEARKQWGDVGPPDNEKGKFKTGLALW